MLEWAFANENKVRIRFIERELKRIKQSQKEILSVSKNNEMWKTLKTKLLAVVRMPDFT